MDAGVLSPRAPGASSSAHARGGRTLASYLLLPRPKDLFKAWILPLGFAVAALGTGGLSADEVLRAAVVWVLLEFLLYQARYQWNDIRGFAADQRHPDAASRGRLPGPEERGRRNKAASWFVIAARLAAAAALAAGFSLWGPVATLTLAVFGTAVVYETLRSRATGYSDAVPPPLRPSLVALWGVVGVGYAIRGLAGMALAAGLDDPVLAVAAASSLWAFGVAFVTGRWALEALSFARVEGEALRWSVRARHAREHSLALVRWLPRCVSPGTSSAKDWRALRDSPRAAPWTFAFILAAAAAGVTGRSLAGQVDVPEALAVAAVAGAIAVPFASGRARLPILLAGALALGGVAALLGAPSPALVPLPWTVICLAHLLFSSQSLATLPHPVRGVLRGRHAG